MTALLPFGTFDTAAPITLPWLALVGLALAGVVASYVHERRHPEAWR